MTAEKNPLEEAVERAIEAFVYAPIGLLFEGSELFPQLVDKGRNQVNMARMVGQFAVEAGQGEAGKAIEKGREQVIGLLGALGVPGLAPSPPGSRPASTPTARPAQRSATRSAEKPAAQAPVADDAALGIPDYDSLSASQVVSRLGGLGGTELDAVREYESATRGRKTILNKVAQLQR